MPDIPSHFEPPFFLRAPCAQTIIPSLFRRIPIIASRCETLELPDGDFLELQWYDRSSHSLVIITHGLEGSADSTYVRGLAWALSANGHSVLAWNMRGCGAKRNRLPTWYHSGQSCDLRSVVSHALSRHSGELSLIGFSVGGNITLKHLGEEGSLVSPRIKRAAVVSVPMDLRGAAETLARPRNRIYMEYLLRPLRARILEKAKRFPHLFDTRGLEKIRDFREFDTYYTAPMHGFASVDAYWDTSSATHFLSSITIPTLIVSAQDDPFLSPGCYPFAQARAQENLLLETPTHGGHVGFIKSLNLSRTWLDERIADFLRVVPPTDFSSEPEVL